MTLNGSFWILMVAGLFGCVACKGESTVTKFCLSAEGTYQDCGIACDVTKDEDACKKWADQTHAVCGEISKQECNQLCEQDQNQTACEVAKTM
jgi:hypothetical protein